MSNRVSSNMSMNDMQYHMNNRQVELNELNNKVGSNRRIKDLRDDPIAASQSILLKSNMHRMEQFSDNIQSAVDHARTAEKHLDSAKDVVNSLYELALKGSNDTMSLDDKKGMAREMDELMTQLVDLSNQKTEDGTAYFGGNSKVSDAFSILKGNVPGSDEAVIIGVEYNGDSEKKKLEIQDGKYIEQDFSGSRLFWAENSSVYSNVRGDNYRVLEDSSVVVNGQEIALKSGDNIHSIVARINSANVAVSASIDPAQQSLVLESKTPGQLWLQDGKGGQVLQDLGLVDGANRPPYNLSKDSLKSGGSVFDMAINVRNQLFQGDTLQTGSRGVQGIELARNNLIDRIAVIGSQEQRMNVAQQRHLDQIVDYSALNSSAVDIDYVQALTDMNTLNFNHRAAMQTAGKVLPQTLMDFLR